MRSRPNAARADRAALKQIVDTQRGWAMAAGRGLPVNEQVRVPTYQQNLFRPLHPLTRREYERGAGHELKGDMRSLRSSAALVCNVFDYWRAQELGTLARACEADPRSCCLAFEATFPTGLSGTPPHLDVLLYGGGARPTAIESKFTEWLQGPHNGFSGSYFNDGVWRDLPRSGAIADRMKEGGRLKRFGAGQILKHALGLTRAFGRDGFRLVYLWHDVPGECSKTHREEIEQFKQELAGEFDFTALTYQMLFARLEREAAAHGEYLAYLRERYFR